MTQQAPLIHGSLVALVTPMLNDGSVDWAALKKLVDWHVEQGTHAIVAVGTTGESATLDMQEHAQVIKAVIEAANGRIPVIAGTGANSTREAIELTQAAKDLGASAALLVTPYYNKPTQEGLYQHHKAIAEAVDLPQILYNVPGRTGVDMSNDTIVRLSAIGGIIGVKDATGDLNRGHDLINRVPKDFAVYSGDDATAYRLILLGAKGNISVTANVAPNVMSQICEAALAGNREEAEQLNNSIAILHQILFCESNPIPVKWALNDMGMFGTGIRLPLTVLAESYQPQIHQALIDSGILTR